MQMISARLGHGTDGMEEEMHTILEALNAKLNAPNQVKAKMGEVRLVFELLSGIKKFV